MFKRSNRAPRMSLLDALTELLYQPSSPPRDFKVDIEREHAERIRLREIPPQLAAYQNAAQATERMSDKYIKNGFAGTPEDSAAAVFVTIARMTVKDAPSGIIASACKAYDAYMNKPADFKPLPWMKTTQQNARLVFTALNRLERPWNAVFPMADDYKDGFFRAERAMDTLLRGQLGDPNFLSSNCWARPLNSRAPAA